MPVRRTSVLRTGAVAAGLALLTACAATVDPGSGEYVGAGPSQSSPPTTEPTETTQTTEPTQTSETTETTSDSPPASEDPAARAAAETAAAAFVLAVVSGNGAGAFDLLCNQDQAETDMDDFIEDAPPTLMLTVDEQVSATAFSATLSYDEDGSTQSGEVFVRAEDGGWCVSQNSA